VLLSLSEVIPPFDIRYSIFCGSAVRFQWSFTQGFGCHRTGTLNLRMKIPKSMVSTDNVVAGFIPAWSLANLWWTASIAI